MTTQCSRRDERMKCLTVSEQQSSLKALKQQTYLHQRLKEDHSKLLKGSFRTGLFDGTRRSESQGLKRVKNVQKNLRHMTVIGYELR